MNEATFTVTMISELLGSFRHWLNDNDLIMARVPDMPDRQYIVVPRLFADNVAAGITEAADEA